MGGVGRLTMSNDENRSARGGFQKVYRVRRGVGLLHVFELVA